MSVRKSEDFLRDYFKEKEELLAARLEASWMNVFLAGMMVGILISYTSLVGVSSGFVVGVVVARRTSPRLFNVIMDRAEKALNVITLFWNTQNYHSGGWIKEKTGG